MKRFRKLQAAAGKDEEDFTRALNGWFDQAAGEKPIQYSKYKQTYGDESIRLLASHLLPKKSLEEEQAQMAPDPQLLFERIKKSKTLNRLVADADRVNPASLYRAAQAVLANPKGDAPPPEEAAANQQRMEAQGMVAPVESRKKTEPEVELVQAEARRVDRPVPGIATCLTKKHGRSTNTTTRLPRNKCTI